MFHLILAITISTFSISCNNIFFRVVSVSIGFISNVIILINLSLKCSKVQRTRGSVFLTFRIFYLSAVDMEKLIKNLNNLTDKSSHDDINSLNVSIKYGDPEYFCNLPGNIKSKSLSIFHHNVCFLSKNFGQLHALLTEIDIDFDFMGITESRI